MSHGHTTRRDAGKLERLMLTGKLDDKGLRGKNPTRSSDQISEQLATYQHHPLLGD